MGFQLFWRICHYTKNTQRNTSAQPSGIKLSAALASAFVAAISVTTSALAESNFSSNVAGDEIIIYSDESFKPAVRDLGATDNRTTSDTSAKDAAKRTVGITTGNSNTAPSYAISTNPGTGNGEAVAAKPQRGGRLGDSLDVSLDSSRQTQDAAAPVVIDIHSDDLWQRIKNGYAMPESTSNLTATHEQWYSSRPDYVKRMVERSQKYLFHVVEEVEKRGMPTEIALLPMIESAYNPKAYSTSRASGIWQFVPSTGKYFGLKQNWWVDNRRNITVATDAALTYLQKLHAMFGAWDLALAAYNAGEGTVARAIERNRRLGLPTDYESLNLPPETKNYVPKLQAVKNLMTNPANYGLNIQTIANTPYFAKVTAPAQIDAHLAAKLAEISDEEFLALNPSFNRPVITSDNKNLELLLPILSAQTFRTNLANYNKPLVSWKTYLAKRGERIEQIASKFGIHVSKLRDVNDLSAQNKMKKAAPILVPNGNRNDFVPSKSNMVADTAPADEPFSLIDSTQSSSNIDLSIPVNIAGNTETSNENEPTKQRGVTHTVKKGEAIHGIAKRYGVTVKQIMAANSLKSSRVKVGQVLNISVDNDKKSASTESKSSKNTKKKQTYIVKRGDTLHSIADKFDVSVDDLKRWNKKYGSHIQPGNKLTITQSDAA